MKDSTKDLINVIQFVVFLALGFILLCMGELEKGLLVILFAYIVDTNITVDKIKKKLEALEE